ncbi:substrate-binding domain-containing protein [Enhygromyxa salina]|uniref:Bacterial extracellular solute-binding protein n=1 Tax=Enhygromyxa salina TaxID=215803 RepID=A0A2S9YTL6_9BACT|nr:substrate-binding domain-containing protein [Enhygromyxa salina]PRQ08457.1 hypothetical protein ENSA7_17420 [Enhygromyxa salina]
MGRARQIERRATLKGVLQLVLIVTVFCFAMAALYQRMRFPSREPTRTWIDHLDLAEPAFTARCGPGDESPLLTVVTSPEKVDWVQHGADTFMDTCRNMRIRVVPRTDFQAIAEIEAGSLTPSLWLPSDELFADYLEDRWILEDRPPLTRGPSLLRMPVVLLMWSDRADALEVLWPDAEASPEFVAELGCPGVARGPATSSETPAPRSWQDWFDDETAHSRRATADTIASWSTIDVRYTTPTRSSMGALVLIAMVEGYLSANNISPTDEDELAHVLELQGDALEDWLRRCDAHGPREFDGPPRTLAQRMFQRGPTGLDGVLIYEHLALEILAQDQPSMQIIYPQGLTVADHPSVTFAGENARSAQLFAQSLAAETMQHQAVSHNLRPSNPKIVLRDAAVPGAQNLFLRLREHGVRLELAGSEPGPTLQRDPLRELLEIWSDATGRN